MLQVYDTYKLKLEKGNDDYQETAIKKMKQHYADVFMASVISPKLTRDKDKKDEMFVEALFNNWEMAQELYTKIMAHTYGKKKILQASAAFQSKGSSSST